MPQDFATIPDGAPLGDIALVPSVDGVLVVLTGEVDLALEPELSDGLRQVIASGQRVRIDVSRLSFIDSTGLAFVAQIAAASQPLGCPPVVFGAHRRIREIITLAGLDELVQHET
jgi:anti-anti-sigma factor